MIVTIREGDGPMAITYTAYVHPDRLNDDGTVKGFPEWRWERLDYYDYAKK